MEIVGTDVSAVVLDSGSYTTKFGYAGESGPSAFFHSSMGIYQSELPPAKRRKTESGDPAPVKNYILGTHLDCRRQNTDVINPFDKGIVINWDAMERIWENCFTGKLQLQSQEHPLLISESTWNTEANRHKAIEIAFEKLQSPAFFMAKDAVLSCYAVGRGTGLVVNSGHQITSIVPVYEGHVLLEPKLRTRIAGDYISNCLKIRVETKASIVPKCLVKSERISGSLTYSLDKSVNLRQSFLDYSQLLVMDEMKKHICGITRDDFSACEKDSLDSKVYILPDGTDITLEVQDRYDTTEKLFNFCHPQLTKLDLDGYLFEGLWDMVTNCISNIDADARKECIGSVVLAGGTTNIPGFRERMATGLEKLPHALKPKIVTMPPTNNGHEQEFTPWIGGSILASLGFFQSFWILPQEYQDEGPRIIKRKCP